MKGENPLSDLCAFLCYYNHLSAKALYGSVNVTAVCLDAFIELGGAVMR